MNVEQIGKTVDASWAEVFAQLEQDKERLLNQRFVIKGKEHIFHKEEMIFYLGNIRAVLTNKGFTFEVL